MITKPTEYGTFVCYGVLLGQPYYAERLEREEARQAAEKLSREILEDKGYTLPGEKK